MSDRAITETIELASGGYLYDDNNPLSSGKVEIFAPVGRHEDILTNKNLISKGLVIHAFYKSLIATQGIDADSMLLGDKSTILLSGRILLRGPVYKATITCPRCRTTRQVDINLSDLKFKEVDYKKYGIAKGQQEFEFKLPNSGVNIKFRLLTHGDEQRIDKEITALEKIYGEGGGKEVTTRLKYIILSVDGSNERKDINNFVDNEFLSLDVDAFKDYLNEITPDVDLTFAYDCEKIGCEQHFPKLSIPLDVNFFWRGLEA